MAKSWALAIWIRLALSRADVSKTESAKDLRLTPWGAVAGAVGIELIDLRSSRRSSSSGSSSSGSDLSSFSDPKRVECGEESDGRDFDLSSMSHTGEVALGVA